jgi:hypothetical protein
MEQLALFALPMNKDEEEEDTSSDDTDEDALDHGEGAVSHGQDIEPTFQVEAERENQSTSSKADAITIGGPAKFPASESPHPGNKNASDFVNRADDKALEEIDPSRREEVSDTINAPWDTSDPQFSSVKWGHQPSPAQASAASHSSNASPVGASTPIPSGNNQEHIETYSTKQTKKLTDANPKATESNLGTDTDKEPSEDTSKPMTEVDAPSDIDSGDEDTEQDATGEIDSEKCNPPPVGNGRGIDRERDDRKRANQRASASTTGQRQTQFFINGDGIDREAITAGICLSLGEDALVRPGTHMVCHLLNHRPPKLLILAEKCRRIEGLGK